MKKYIRLLCLSRAVLYLVSLVSSLLIDHGEQAVGLYEGIFRIRHPLAFKLLRPLVFYDGDFFFEIALTGYNYDKIHAFFPGFPLLVKQFQTILSLILPTIEEPLLIIVAAYLLNFALSLCNLVFLKRLFELFGPSNERLKDLTLKILILNPLSIYLSAFYSEALFLFTQLLGLLWTAKWVAKGEFSFIQALVGTLIFCLGGFVRSNGFLSGGFVIYFYILYNLQAKVTAVLKCLFVTKLIALVSVLPFLIVQYTGYQTLCADNLNNYSFCTRRFPSVYNFIQKKYWDVEFLGMIEGRRWVNLVYILPIFVVLFTYGVEKLKLGSFKQRMFSIFKLKKVRDFDDFLVPNFYLFLLLLTIGLTVMHYNSFTRLLGGYPLFYIFIAELYLNSGGLTKALMRFWLGAFQIFIVVFAVNNYLPI